MTSDASMMTHLGGGRTAMIVPDESRKIPATLPTKTSVQSRRAVRCGP
ncbi:MULTISPECIES: hypothetical protein [Rhodococcus]|uniref:Uncharacterized protein n=1 Tax=Rhodococcus qingshengii JCM 15477 TaxID=1303681 RepID=A0AB38RMD8_RHOSG|nr:MULTISPECIES: hypothetical protein [Rhodococcus]MDA3635166.1 hypothetical protein [Rhodococcus sp. C-2]UPU46488.1 hypothetical protein M0639_32600 [Rhodococcus qingshengii JCM 15477]